MCGTWKIKRKLLSMIIPNKHKYKLIFNNLLIAATVLFSLYFCQDFFTYKINKYITIATNGGISSTKVLSEVNQAQIEQAEISSYQIMMVVGLFVFIYGIIKIINLQKLSKKYEKEAADIAKEAELDEGKEKKEKKDSYFPEALAVICLAYQILTYVFQFFTITKISPKIIVIIGAIICLIGGNKVIDLILKQLNDNEKTDTSFAKIGLSIIFIIVVASSLFLLDSHYSYQHEQRRLGQIYKAEYNNKKNSKKLKNKDRFSSSKYPPSVINLKDNLDK